MAIDRKSTRPRRRPGVLQKVSRPDDRLSDFMDASVDAFVLLDHDLTFIRTNVAFQKLFGLSDTDVAGKNIAEVFANVRESGMYDDYMSVIESGIPLSFDDVVPGSAFGDIHLSVKAFKVGSGLGIIATDITERKQIENALRQSERSYRLLFESTIDGMGVIDAETMRFVLANEQAARMFGFNSVEEAIRVDIADYLHPRDRDRVIKIIREDMFAKDLRATVEFQAFAKDGRELWISAVGTRTEYQGRLAGLVSVRDITEHKTVEQARRESEEHYAALVSNLTDAVLKFKAGTVAWCNERVDEVYGYTKDELVGSEASFFYPEGVSPSDFGQLMSTSMKQHGCFRGTSKFRKKDGTTADIEYSLSLIPGQDPIELIAVARDITERKQMEEELRKSEEKLSRYLESSPDAIFITDSAGRFLYANRAAVELTGYQKQQSLGRSFLDLDLLPPDYASKAAQVLNLNISGKPTGPDEFEMVAHDGRRVFVEISTYPMGKGDETEIIGIARDITERKLAEEEKTKLEGQLQVAGRLAAVGELAAGVAHELNNPLAAVQAFAQFLAAKGDLDHDTKRDVETIYREAQRATKITGNLLCFARRNRPEKSLISVNEAICRTVDLFAYRTRVNNIELATDLSPNLPETMADFHQMQQVFVNIINNAEQAMAEAQGKGKLVVKTRKAGEMIRVTFTDSGPGISDDNLKRIFDPFFTTKAVGKGTGLGLSICYGLIQGHGGNMYARSKPGKGATFVVEIPIVPEAEPTVQHADPIHIQGVSGE